MYNPEERPRPGPGARKAQRRPDALCDPRGEYTAAEHAAALRVRRLYAYEMRRIRAGYGFAAAYTPHRRWDGFAEPGPEGGPPRPAVWLRVARTLASWGVDPAEYVRCQFEAVRPSGPPQPSQLVTPAAREAYLVGLPAASVRVRDALASEAALATQSIRVALAVAPPGTPPRRTWEEVLLTPDPRLSPLFRYCLGASEGLEAVTEAYAEEAAHQYSRWPSLYDQHWGDRVPPEVRDRALRLEADLREEAPRG